MRKMYLGYLTKELYNLGIISGNGWATYNVRQDTASLDAHGVIRV